MDCIFKSVHKIDYDAESIVEVEMYQNFDDFVTVLLTNINENVVNKLYVPSSQSTQVVSDVRNIFELLEFSELEMEKRSERVKSYDYFLLGTL